MCTVESSTRTITIYLYPVCECANNLKSQQKNEIGTPYLLNKIGQEKHPTSVIFFSILVTKYKLISFTLTKLCYGLDVCHS